jgi:hypothetical protein
VTDYVWLKWRTLKEVQYSTPAQFAALERYHADRVSMSAMLQENTDAQKQALCDLIDAIAANGGDIIDAWTLEKITPEAGKRYVMEG